ncbi:MAG: diaminopimelate epimerase, partial [Rhodospirillales bacterium]|nr:diaminopimelate epimerase [Rhodospirillales bacterium]
KADVELDGGVLNIEWLQDDHVLMTGSASKVFSGTLELSELS